MIENLPPIQYHIRINRLFNEDYDNGFYPKNTKFEIQLTNPLKYAKINFINKSSKHSIFNMEYKIENHDDFEKHYSHIKEEYTNSNSNEKYIKDQLRFNIEKKELARS